MDLIHKMMGSLKPAYCMTQNVLAIARNGMQSESTHLRLFPTSKLVLKLFENQPHYGF